MGTKDLSEDMVDLLMGETIVYDENGKRVHLCDIPPASFTHFTVLDYDFNDIKKAFKELAGKDEAH